MGEPDLLQKPQQGLHHATEGTGTSHAVPQVYQGGDAPFSGAVQLPQQRCTGLGLLPSQSLGMMDEGAVPFFAPNAPEHRIILQLVADFGLHGGKHGLEISQDRPLLQSLHGRIQGGQHRRDGGLLQNIIGSAQIHRQTAPVEHQRQHALIAGIGADDADIPVAAAAPHQLHDLLRRDLALIKNGVAAAGEEMFFQSRHALDLTLEQLFPDGAQRIPARLHLPDLHRDLQPPAGLHQLPGGLSRLLKAGMLGGHRIGGQTHRHHGGAFDQMADNGHMLPGQVGEALYVKFMIFRKIAAFQLLQQPVHLVSGVCLAPGADGIVAFKDQRQLLELAQQDAAASFAIAAVVVLKLLKTDPLRSLVQIARRDAAALELVHHIQKSRQKFRSGLQPGIGLELAGKLPDGGSHGGEPSAVVQALLRHILGLLADPAQEPGEGQHLGIAAGDVPRRSAEPPLGIVADELGNHQDLVSLPAAHLLRDLAQDGLPARDPVCG